MSDYRTVLLAGASGVFGRHVNRALSQAGYQVKTLGRGPANDISADLLDRTGLMEAVRGHQADVVIHAATALRKAPLRERDMHRTNELRVEGTRNLVAAARELGATRMISESMIFGYGFGDHGPRPLTEDDPFGVRGSVPTALRIKEEMTFEFGGIALRFGLFYGQGATEEIVAMLRKRMLPAPTSSHLLPWVDLADAASAVVAAIERGRPGHAYNIADASPTSFGDQVRAIAQAFGTPQPWKVPLWMLRPMSYLHRMLTTHLLVDTTKAQRELAWAAARSAPGVSATG